jgi:hypothetical protein
MNQGGDGKARDSGGGVGCGGVAAGAEKSRPTRFALHPSRLLLRDLHFLSRHTLCKDFAKCDN